MKTCINRTMQSFSCNKTYCTYIDFCNIYIFVGGAVVSTVAVQQKGPGLDLWINQRCVECSKDVIFMHVWGFLRVLRFSFNSPDMQTCGLDQLTTLNCS